MDQRCCTKLAAVRDGFHFDLLFTNGQVHKAIHVVKAVGVGRTLCGDATTPARYKVWAATKNCLFIFSMHLLLVCVACNKQVNAILLLQFCKLIL